MTLKTYDPKDVQIIWGAIAFSGYADGSFITIERNNPAFELHKGTDGESARSKSNDKSGMITVTLMATSETNRLLSIAQVLDEKTNVGIVPVLVNDKGGYSIYSDPETFLEGPPSAEFDRTIGTREWKIICPNLEMFTGGN